MNIEQFIKDNSEIAKELYEEKYFYNENIKELASRYDIDFIDAIMVADQYKYTTKTN